MILLMNEKVGRRVDKEKRPKQEDQVVISPYKYAYKLEYGYKYEFKLEYENKFECEYKLEYK
jgi:hypothetical protein